MGRYCAVSVCKHNSSKTKVHDKQIIYHRFPMGNDLLSKSIRDEWIRRCTRDCSINPATSQICSDHFCETDYERDLKNELLNLPQKRKLKATAVPTLNLGYVEIKKSEPSNQSISIAIKERKILIQKILDSSATSMPKTLPTKADGTAKHRETHHVCAVNSCKYVKVSSPKLSYFRFPKALDMREKWIERCHRPSPFKIEAARVCSRHFKEDDFEEDFQARILKQEPKRMLKKTAIPSILLDAAVDITERSTLAPLEEVYIQCPDIIIDSSESDYIDTDEPSVKIENIQPVTDDNIQHSKTVSTISMPKQRDANKLETSDIPPVKPSTSIGAILTKEANSTAVIKCPQENVPNQDLQQATTSSKSVVKPPPTLNAYLVNNNNQLQILIGKAQPIRNVEIQKNAKVGSLPSQLPEENLCLTTETIRVICRVCLLKQGNVNLYETKYKDLYYSDVLEAVTGLKMKKENPMSICNGCVQDLIKSYSFKIQSEKSELALIKFKQEMMQTNNNMEIEITNKELIDHDYAITSFKSVQENLLNVSNNVPVQPSQLIFAQNPTPMFYLYNGAITSLQSVQQNPPNVANDASTQPSPLVFAQNPTPTFYLHSGAITSVESVQENPENVINDLPNQPSPLVFPANAPFNLNNGNLNNNDVIDKTEAETLAKKKPTVRKKKLPDLMSKIAWNERTRHVRRAYRLIATGNVEEGKKLLADNNIKIPPRLLLALEPSECKVCGDHLNSEYEYKKHAKLTKHYRTPFPCDHCNRIFPSKCMLQTHKTCVLRASRLCDICGASFSSNKGLMQHVTKTHREKKYQCKICGICHTDLGQLFRHKWHAHRDLRKPRKKVNREVCDLCGAILGSKTALSAHKARMHQNLVPRSRISKNRHACSLCEASFPYIGQLEKHQSVHSSERYECGFCNGMFKDHKKFINHRLERHAVLSIDADVSIEYVPSHCTFCVSVCPNKQALSVHLKEHGIDVCVYCDDLFDNAKQLVDHHIKLHENLPEWMCRYCNKTYEDRNSLLSHLSLHKCKTYKCDNCPKLFDSSNRLKRHKLIHGEELNYECRFCSKRFRYQCTTVVHERIHTGERPYKCDICGSGHICASTRKKHRQTHLTTNNDHFDDEALTLEAHTVKKE